MIVADSKRMDVKNLLKSVIEDCEKRNFIDHYSKELAKEGFGYISNQVKKILEDFERPFQLAVLGEFNSGKSCFINSILKRKNYLPEGVTPTTAAITEIRYGKNELITAFYKDEKDKKEVSLDEFHKMVNQQNLSANEAHNIKKKVERFIVELPEPILHNSSIIDTLGLQASLFDNKISMEYFYRADAIIWLFDACCPGGEDRKFRLSRCFGKSKLRPTILQEFQMRDSSFYVHRWRCN